MHSILNTSVDWYTLPLDVWWKDCNLSLVHHANTTTPSVSAYSVQKLMLILTDQYLYENYQEGADWVY